MTSDKKNVALLRALFLKKGLKQIVISPGSRNAPIIIAFASHPDIEAMSVVDERSAAFFALGMAQQSGKTVAIASTSGTAPLNYAPAIAEAYYQKIPLLVLTADRPPMLVDVGDGQTIRQQKMYANYIKKSYQLPVEIDNKSQFAEAEKMVNEAIDLCRFPIPGPVHINIPFDEPLYGTTEEEPEVRVRNYRQAKEKPDDPVLRQFVQLWKKSDKIMVLAGQQFPSQKLQRLVGELSAMPQVIVLTETTSNFHNNAFVDCIDNVMVTLKGKEADFAPDLLITFGDAVVSKMIKRFLRNNKPAAHWHIDTAGEKRDTYFSLTQTVSLLPELFFEKVIAQLKPVKSNFGQLWSNQKQKVSSARGQYMRSIPFSDMKVFQYLLSAIPGNSNLHLGNSTPVRYSQLFGSLPQFTYFSNRGVSGIDGQVSTAAGVAKNSNKINTLITGDLGFFYDSNGLMNNNLTPNLKIIVINNGGGGIFRFIAGPRSTPFLEDFFEAKHHWNAKGLADAFQVDYYRATNEWALKAQLPVFYKMNKRPGLLEIVTPGKESGEILINYFRFLVNEVEK